MLEGFIKQCKRRIERLEAQMETEDLTPQQAARLLKEYEQEHELLKELTGDKGNRRPTD